MKNGTFRQAYEAAATELNTLLVEQEGIEERILSLRKTMNALSILISQTGGKDKDILDEAAARIREVVDASLTDDIYRIITAAKRPLRASEIREELKELGNALAEHSNPLATIHAITSRLVESGRAVETLKDGKKAWERVPFTKIALLAARKGLLSEMK
jgi:hypothetical protein